MHNSLDPSSVQETAQTEDVAKQSELVIDRVVKKKTNNIESVKRHQ